MEVHVGNEKFRIGKEEISHNKKYCKYNNCDFSSNDLLLHIQCIAMYMYEGETYSKLNSEKGKRSFDQLLA